MTTSHTTARLKRHGLALLVALSPALASAQTFVGVIYPTRDLTLSVSVSGVVSRVPVKIGQRVRAGQPLLELESDLQSIELRRRRTILEDLSEQASITERHRILERLFQDASKLYEQTGSISREELMKLQMELVSVAGRRDQLQLEKKREQHEVDLAQQEKQMRVLVAPVSGVVTSIQVDTGEWATPGQPIVRLVDESSVELRTNLSQAAARLLNRGDTIEVVLDDPAQSQPLQGRVAFLSPVADAASGLVEVRITLANAERRIRPGVKGRIQLNAAAS
ncbi:efflux RND transporter periplasmic adaptor subunit [Hydrogenophaga sp.]|uniref:efflux RND transporter periplasmic adaptor subunit n=1 Tax=Hydrogenophaga sp. TaxID=1904254 RepID=UPI003F6BA5ED